MVYKVLNISKEYEEQIDEEMEEGMEEEMYSRDVYWSRIEMYTGVQQ